MSNPYRDLIYAVSHDLASPVRRVQGFAQLLTEHLAEVGDGADERTRKLAGHVRDGAAELRDMMDGLLDLSRIGTRELRLEPTDLDEVARGAAILACHNRKLPDAVELSGALPTLRTDEDLVRRALSALIDNALLYAGAARVSADSADGTLRIWVRDDGPGIRTRQQVWIFRPFDRGDPPEGTQGVGLGLAVARRAAERLQGAIGVESAPGEGAAFWLDLPLG